MALGESGAIHMVVPPSCPGCEAPLKTPAQAACRCGPWAAQALVHRLGAGVHHMPRWGLQAPTGMYCTPGDGAEAAAHELHTAPVITNPPRRPTDGPPGVCRDDPTTVLACAPLMPSSARGPCQCMLWGPVFECRDLPNACNVCLTGVHTASMKSFHQDV